MERTLTRVFEEATDRWPERPAVMRDGGPISYAALREQARGLAGALLAAGLGGRRVGVLLPNLPTFPQLYQGLLAAGARPVMLNPVNSPREVAEHTADAQVAAVATVGPLAGHVPPGVPVLLVDELPERLHLRAAGEARPLELDPGRAPAPADDAAAEGAILFTAANAGRARGAVLSHRNLVANLRATAQAKRLTPDDVVVAALPWIHAFGLTACLNAPLSAGAALLPVERFHPARLLAMLESPGPTVLCGVPAMYLGLLSVAERQGVPRHALRVALSGGAPVDPAVQRRWEELFGLPLRQGYGITEASPVCLFNQVDRPNRPGTLGYPLPGVEVSIRDPGGDPLPPGEVGELCVRGENVFRGYLGEPERRPGDFHGDWFRTGDLACEEADGAIRFRGILKPMFTRNGFNVYPREIERVLAADPRVAAAEVFALPDAARENDIVLSVRPAAGLDLTEDEVRELCRAQLAAYKQPTRVRIETGPGTSPRAA